jgi:hypothetical protein
MQGLTRCSESANEIKSTESLIADVLQKMISSSTPGTNRLFQREKQLFTLAIIREYQIADEVHKASLFSDIRLRRALLMCLEHRSVLLKMMVSNA